MTVSIVGCSQVTGPIFLPVEHFGPNRALVYLYFPIQKGHKAHHTILANGTVLTGLDTQTYYPFVTPPGRITFAMEGLAEQRNVTVDVEADRAYFARVTLIGTGRFIFNAFYQLELVPPDVAIPEIKYLHLMASCGRTQGCSR